MSSLLTYNVYKGESFEVNAPYHCSSSKLYDYRIYLYNTGSLAGIVIGNTTDVTALPKISGPITSVEGIYYWDYYQVTMYSYQPQTASYKCQYTSYYNFYDNDYYESLKRF